VVQQRDGDAHAVEPGVQVPDQGGADPGAAFLPSTNIVCR